MRHYFDKNHLVIYICAIFIFLFCFYIFSKQHYDWGVYSPDTPHYFNLQIKDPWQSLRSPGLALFYTLITNRELLDKTFNNPYVPSEKVKDVIAAHPELKLENLFKRIALANIVLCSFAYALLFLALARFIPIAWAFFSTLFCASFAPTYYLHAILADPPAYAICIIFAAVLLCQFSSKRLLVLFLLCLIAAYGVLLKPALIFIALIAFFLCSVLLIQALIHHNRRRAFFVGLITIFLFISSASWPIWISVKGGILAANQIGMYAKGHFSAFLIQPGDEELFQKPQHKKFISRIIQEKPEKDKQIEERRFKKGKENYSKAYIYISSIDDYEWDFFLKYFHEIVRPASVLDMYRQTNEIYTQLIRKHRSEYLKIVARSFLSAFDYYNDLNYPFLQNNLPKLPQLTWLNRTINKINHSVFLWNKNLTFYLFVFSYFLIILAIIFAKKSRLRWPLAIIAAMHPLHCAIMAYGVGVFPRYLTITQWSLILAVLLSLYIWSDKIYNTYLAHRNAKSIAIN